MKLYLVHPISGLSADEVFNYFETNKKLLESYGYEVLTAMFGKKHLRCEKEFRAKDYTMPCTTNHAIFERDHWMVERSDVIFANFLTCKGVSIGSMMELAWANHLHKHIVVVMNKDNVHSHAFVHEAASIVYETQQEAINYLKTLIKMEF